MTDNEDTEEGPGAEEEEQPLQEFAEFVTPSQEAAGEVGRLQEILQVPTVTVISRTRVRLAKDFSQSQILTSEQARQAFAEQRAASEWAKEAAAQAKEQREQARREKQEQAKRKKQEKEADQARKRAEVARKKLEAQALKAQAHAQKDVTSPHVPLMSLDNEEDLAFEQPVTTLALHGGVTGVQGQGDAILLEGEGVQAEAAMEATTTDIVASQGTHQPASEDQVVVPQVKAALAAAELQKWQAARQTLLEMERAGGMDPSKCELCKTAKQACGSKKAPKHCPRKKAVTDILASRQVELDTVQQALVGTQLGL